MTWKDELYNEYHYLFDTTDIQNEIDNQNDIPLWIISVNDGWKEPVKRYLKRIDSLQKGNRTDDKKIQILTIKQKLGVIQVWIDYPERLESTIEGYEGRLKGECYMTCELCGQAHTNGISKIGHWRCCICDACKINRITG